MWFYDLVTAMTGYVFYDTETTGTLPAYDQILQFGAIRTDEDLNEINRFEIRCRIMPHIVPATKALEVTGVTPNMLIDPSLPSHYEAKNPQNAVGLVSCSIYRIQFNLIRRTASAPSILSDAATNLFNQYRRQLPSGFVAHSSCGERLCTQSHIGSNR